MTVRVGPRPAGVPADLGAPLLPGSKSHSQRALVLAAFLPGRWELTGALRSADTEVLGRALEVLGAQVSFGEGGVRVRGRSGGTLDGTVDLGENGTAARCLLAVVPLLGGRLRVDGRKGLRRRPMAAVLDPLAAAGALVSSRQLPVTVDGRGVPWPDCIAVDARTTTQAASGFLLGQALRSGSPSPGVRRVRALAPAAAAYLHLTAAVLRSFGFAVDHRDTAEGIECTVAGPGRGGGEVSIPADPSARTFFLVAAALHGRDGAVLWPRLAGDPHPEWPADEDVARIAGAAPGAEVVVANLAARPDSFPALAALAAAGRATVHFTGVPALRHKESDRIAAMAAGLEALGAAVAEDSDGLTVRGPLAQGTTAVAVPCPPDHRVVMALALLGTVHRAGVVLEHAGCVAKSWPGFWDWLGRNARVDGVGRA